MVLFMSIWKGWILEVLGGCLPMDYVWVAVGCSPEIFLVVMVVVVACRTEVLRLHGRTPPNLYVGLSNLLEVTWG
jgi:hypothetical protein